MCCLMGCSIARFGKGFIVRRLLNAGELADWARNQGFHDLRPAAWHLTVIRNEAALSACLLDRSSVTIEVHPSRVVTRMGGFITLEFRSDILSTRHAVLRQAGGRWDFEYYRPHVSFTWGDRRLLEAVFPFQGPLHFGPEVFEGLGGTPLLDYICHRLPVSESIRIDGAGLFTKERKNRGHVSSDSPANAEQIRNREMSPVIAIPPRQEKVCSACALPGVGPREVNEPFQGRLHFRIRENFNGDGVILGWMASAARPQVGDKNYASSIILSRRSRRSVSAS